jgi:hypothetical protein
MKYDKIMRKTLENLIILNKNGNDISKFLETAYPDNCRPSLNVSGYFLIRFYFNGLKNLITVFKYIRQQKYLLKSKLNERDARVYKCDKRHNTRTVTPAIKILIEVNFLIF